MQTSYERPMTWAIGLAPTIPLPGAAPPYGSQDLLPVKQLAQGGIRQYPVWTETPTPPTERSPNWYIPPEPGAYSGTNQITLQNGPHGMRGTVPPVPFQETDSAGSNEPVNMQYRLPYPFDQNLGQLLQQLRDGNPNGGLLAFDGYHQMPGIQAMAGAEPDMLAESSIGPVLPPPSSVPDFVTENNGFTGEENEYLRTSVSLSPSLSLSVPSLQVSSSTTPAPSASSSVSVVESPRAENEADLASVSTARKQPKRRKRGSDQRPFGEACDRCWRRKISCRETVEGPCVACTRHARRHPDHVCTTDREIGKRGRPKGVKDGEGRASRVAKGGKRAGRKTKGIVTPDELSRQEVGMEEGTSETGSQSTGFDVQQHHL